MSNLNGGGGSINPTDQNAINQAQIQTAQQLQQQAALVHLQQQQQAAAQQQQLLLQQQQQQQIQAMQALQQTNPMNSINTQISSNPRVITESHGN